MITPKNSTQAEHRSLTGTKSRMGTKSQMAALLAVLAFAGGCAPTVRHGAAPTVRREAAPTSHLYVGLDTSGSFRPYLGVAATLCARQAMGLDPDRDRLTLYRLDSSTREFSDGPAPDSADRLQRAIVTEVQAPSDARGTFPARFWESVADRLPGDTGPVTVEVFSDGDNDDETAASAGAIRRAARRFAADPHVVSLCVFGADPRCWATLRAEFAPLGGRFHLCSPPEMTADRVVSAARGGQ